MSTITSKTARQVLASTARTTTGQGGPISVGNADFVSILVNVTAVSGTSPSMTVNVEWSDDGVTWYSSDPVDAFAAITAVSAKAKRFAVNGLLCRLNYAITGTTPSFTFAASAVVGN